MKSEKEIMNRIERYKMCLIQASDSGDKEDVDIYDEKILLLQWVLK